LIVVVVVVVSAYVLVVVSNCCIIAHFVTGLVVAVNKFLIAVVVHNEYFFPLFAQF